VWRLWLAFANARDHYRAEVDDAVCARLLRPEDAIPLVMLAIWLHTSKERRHPTRLAHST
jgi:hypothetical protein